MNTTPVTIALSLVLAAAATASGQQYRGQDGTLLDRNNRVGSNGRNTAVRDVRTQIQLNNAIVTGNAGASRSFRGYVGYTAPSDFRTPGGYLGTSVSRDLTFNTGTDSQFAFRRDSSSGYSVSSGVRPSDALRYQLALSTGQTAPSFLAAGQYQQREAAAATGASVSSALRSTADFLTSRSLRPTLVGSRTDAERNEWNAVASPLLGVSWLRVGFEGAPPPPSPTEPGAVSGGLGTLDVNKAPKMSRQPLMPTGLESRAQGMYSLTERGAMEEAARSDKNNASTAVDAAASDTSVPNRAVVHRQVLDTLRTAYPGADKPAPGADEKLDLSKPQDLPQSALERDLDRIRRVLRGQPLLPPAKPEGTTPPTDQPAQPAGTDAKSAPADGPALSPELLRAMKSLGVKNLESLAAESTGPADVAMYQRHMEMGQRLLAESSFFDAEDRFTRAVASAPTDPLAKVGRIHAQIGAGLYLSAFANLRRLMTDSPELIGAKYDAKLLPTPRRTLVIADQLREDIKGGTGMAFEASLLLAYLGHASGNSRMLEDGLQALDAKVAADDKADKALVDLVKQIWGPDKQDK